MVVVVVPPLLLRSRVEVVEVEVEVAAWGARDVAMIGSCGGFFFVDS